MKSKALTLLTLTTVLAGLVIVLVFSALPVFGNTITVTNTNESGPGSLRDAIATAAPGDTINFSVTGTIILTTGEIGINKSLSITGPGANSLAINGNLSGSQTCFCRVFSIGSGITVNISGVTIENGSNSNGGGGIFNSGTLTLTNSTVSGNDAVFGGGTGGGIFNNGGTLTLTNSTVPGNSAGKGAGIANNGGTLTLTNSTVSGNSAFYGTGIYQYNGGTLTLTNSTVSGNGAGTDGGGIYNASGTLTLTNSTVSGNGTNYGGGGIYNSGTATLTNSTVSGNFSNLITGGGSIGGGIFNTGGTLRLSNSTVSGNSAVTGGGIYTYGGSLEVKNTLVANSPSGGNCYVGTGTATSDGHNLSDDTSCSSFFTQTGDVNNTPAGLDPNGLQDNGGPTKTIVLLVGSPAVDAIPVSDCTDVNLVAVTTDQRGVARPHGPACDIGAFELGPSAAQGQIVGLGPATLWVGLKNSDDQGTQFDLRVEVYNNNSLVSAGQTLCVTGVTRNPSNAKEVALLFGAIAPSVLASGNILSLKVLTRIGTNSGGSKCSGPGGSHSNAVGLRLYDDATSRPSHFSAQIFPAPPTDLFLHSGAGDLLDSTPPTSTTPATKDSPAVNFAGGNPWKEIGTWNMTIP